LLLLVHAPGDSFAREVRGPRLLRVPDVRQATVYTCGPASLQSVLAYYGRGEPRECVLAKQLRTTRRWGTEPEDLKRVAERYGLRAEIRSNMTLAELDRLARQRVPVIVDYQAWPDGKGPAWRRDWADGHYSVLIGTDRRNVYLEDPVLLGRRGYIPRKEFRARWHDLSRRGEPQIRLGIVLRSATPPRPERVARIK